VVVGGLGAVGAALYGLGIPKDSVLQYETALRSNQYLVVVHGTAADVATARTILGVTSDDSRAAPTAGTAVTSG
jgi:hypothetical protein